MSILRVVNQPKRFEDFVSNQGTADIFQKMYELEAVLEENYGIWMVWDCRF